MFLVGLNRILGRLTHFRVVWLVFGWLGRFWLDWLDSYFRMDDFVLYITLQTHHPLKAGTMFTLI